MAKAKAKGDYKQAIAGINAGAIATCALYPLGECASPILAPACPVAPACPERSPTPPRSTTV
jgi:hypothetical protein